MRAAALILTLIVSACGVADVGTTAATTAKLKADEAKQGKEAMDRIQAELDAAQKAEQQRVSAAAAQQ